MKEFMKKAGIKPKKGDWIVHTYHGIGKVMGYCTKIIRGEKRVYLEIKTNDLTYWLPITDSSKNHIRFVSTPSIFKEALTTIGDLHEPLSENFRVRISHINEEIETGSLISKAQLIRDIYERNARKSIHTNEKWTLEKLKIQFIEELMLACNLNRQNAQAKLKKALQKSCESL